MKTPTFTDLNPGDLLDALERYFPLIGQLAATPQDPRWHAEGNVRIHTARVIAEAQAILSSPEGATLSEDRGRVLVLGAALHDIGKALTTREVDIEGATRITSPHHPDRGRSYLAPLMGGFPVSPEVRDHVLALVGYHHQPAKAVVRALPFRSLVRLRRAVDFELVYLLELADLRGRDLAEGENDRDGFEVMELFRQAAEEANLWHPDANPYAEWKCDNDYVLGKARRQFEAGLIFSGEEANAKYYEHRAEHAEVVLVCGPSGSGKSRWIDERLAGFERITLDEIRREVTGKEDDQSMNGQVLQAAKERLRAALRRKARVVWDATSLRRDGRAMVVELAHDYFASTRIVALACSPAEAKRRNRKRERQVAESVIDRQYERMQWPEVWEAEQVDAIFV